MAIEMIRLNLIPDGNPPVVHCKQFDVGRRFRVCVFEGSKPYIFTNETVELDVRKNDTTLVSVDLEVESGKRYVDVVTTEQMCAVTGKQEAEIRIYSDALHTTEIGSLSFYIQVERSVVNGGLVSASEVANLARQVHDQVVIELHDHGAEDTGYNNAYSGLDAENVQAAIDEVNDKVDTKADAQEMEQALATKADAQETAQALNTKADAEATRQALATKADAQAVSQAFEGVAQELATKANATETTQALNNKADKNSVYDKQTMDSKLAEKESITDLERDYYNKTQVDRKFGELPEPMVIKGTLGVNGTITALPTASADNEGYTYKVITDGTYAGQTAKEGDMFSCYNPEGTSEYAWLYIPSGDDINDTWRAIKVNGVEKLDNGISSGNVDFEDTDNVKFTFDSNGNKIKASLSGIDTSEEVDTKVAGLIDDETASEGKVYSSSKVVGLLGDKANVDGEYNDMVVGNAKQLKSNVGENDKVPYLFRTSGGSIDIGESEEDTLVGGTVAFNQLIPNGDFANGSTGWGTTSGATVAVNNKEATVNGSSDYFGITQRKAFIQGHKYLLASTVKVSTLNNKIYPCYVNSSYIRSDSITPIDTNYHTYSFIKEAIQSGTDILIGVRSGTYSGEQTIYVKNVQLIDLTQMFGSTIADYIYNLEQSTEGAGVAWFRNLFPKDYYAYNTGELMSVKATKHIMTGFNAWDEEWEVGGISDTTGQNITETRIRSKNYIPVLPNTSYYFKASMNFYVIACYDANKSFISVIASTGRNSVKTIPDNCYYIRFSMVSGYGTTYNHDICINLSWDGERDGEYEPYVKYEYPLDSNLELRGIPKLDANNKLYYDGDTYESDGTVTRKYGVVDLGTLNWLKATRDNNKCFYASISNGMPVTGSQGKGNAVCQKKYTLVKNIDVGVVGADKVFNCGSYWGTGCIINIRDSDYEDSDTATFKTAMSGIYLVYELAEPTTETADTFTNPQKVNDFGTEEYEDNRTVPIPVGHDTFYQANLRAKLEMAPDSPSGDGDYIVRQSNGQNEYVPLVKELPTLPNSNGTYTLKCTVSGSSKTLSWVQDT